MIIKSSQNNLKEKKIYRIGIDLDNTLVKFDTPPAKIAAKKIGLKSYPFKHDYYYSNYPEKLREALFRLFEDPTFMGKISPLSGAVEKLKQWKKDGHLLILITARQGSVESITKKKVFDFFPMIDEIYFVNRGRSKKEIFEKEKIEIWIDDNPFDVDIAFNLKIKTYLITNSDTPYNWDYKDKTYANIVERVANINFY